MPHKLERRLADLERKAPVVTERRIAFYHVIDPYTKDVVSRLVHVPEGAPIEITEMEENALAELSKVSTLSIPAMIDHIRANSRIPEASL